MPLSGETRSELPRTTQLFSNYHRHLQYGYRDTDREYPANCRDIALELAAALIQDGHQASFVRLRPNPDIAPLLRPSVYATTVEWDCHVVAMDDQGNIHDPMLAAPTPYEEYLQTSFLDNNADPYEVIEGDMVRRIIDANRILSSLGI